MKIFLSFSGIQSRTLAGHLKQLLEFIFDNTISVYISADEPGGSEWVKSITEQLKDANLGVCCITRDSLDSIWIHFEAGYLFRGDSRTRGSERIIPYICGMSDKEFRGPLSQLVNPLFANRDGTLKLAQTINKQLKKPLTDNILSQRLDHAWANYNEYISALSSPLFKKSSSTQLKERESAAVRVRAYNDTLDAEVGNLKSPNKEGVDRETAYLQDTVLQNIRRNVKYEYVLARRPWNHSFDSWATLVSEQVITFRGFVGNHAGHDLLKSITLNLLYCEPPISHISIDIYDFDGGANAGFWCIDGPTIRKPDHVIEVLDQSYLRNLWVDLQQVAERFSVKGTLEEIGRNSDEIYQRLVESRREFLIDDQRWQELSSKISFSILSRMIGEF